MNSALLGWQSLGRKANILFSQQKHLIKQPNGRLKRTLIRINKRTWTLAGDVLFFPRLILPGCMLKTIKPSSCNKKMVSTDICIGYIGINYNGKQTMYKLWLSYIEKSNKVACCVQTTTRSRLTYCIRSPSSFPKITVAAKHCTGEFEKHKETRETAARLRLSLQPFYPQQNVLIKLDHELKHASNFGVLYGTKLKIRSTLELMIKF